MTAGTLENVAFKGIRKVILGSKSRYGCKNVLFPFYCDHTFANKCEIKQINMINNKEKA